MPLQFYLGRAGSGKTRRCLDEIADRLRHDAGPKSPPLLWLLPEQATAQAETDLLRAPGVEAFARAHVLSFRRLARLVLDETGFHARTHWLDEQGREMVLRALVARRRDALRVFGRSAGERGFVQRLAALFKEFTHYRITSDDLAAELRRLEQAGLAESLVAGKLHDLLTLARAWDQRRAESKDADPDHFLDELARRVEASALIRHAEVWIDGFASFTPQELRVLGQMMQHAASLRVTLLLDLRRLGLDPAGGDMPQAEDAGNLERLFGQTEESFLKLRALAEEMDVETSPPVLLPESAADGPPRFSAAPGLGRLEAQLAASDLLPGVPASTSSENPSADRASDDEDADPPLTIVRAGTRRDETEAVAREIRRLCREGRPARYRGSAVIVRDMDAYESLLRESFERHGIPFFIDRRRPILHHPLVRLLRAALALVSGPWDFDDVVDYLKTDFAPAERAEADAIENYAVEHGVRGRRGWTSGRWDTPPPRDADEPEDLQDFTEPPGSAPEIAESLDEARTRAFAPLLSLEARLQGAGCRPEAQASRPPSSEQAPVTGRALIEGVLGFLESLEAARKMSDWIARDREAGALDSADEHEQAWEAVMGLLGQTALVLETEAMPLEEMTEALAGGLETLTMALAPPALDGVLVGSVDRSRQPPLDNVFVLGFHEGGFPRPVSEDLLLNDGERLALEESGGLALGPSATRRTLNERYLAYVALTRASRRLWVSRPGVDEAERELAPSPWLAVLLACAQRGNVKVRELTVSAENLDESVASLETLDQAIEGVLRHAGEGTGSPAPWRLIRDGLTELPEAADRLERARRLAAEATRPARLSATALDLIPDLQRPLSVSRLQTYAECPFHYFADHALRLRERLAFQIQAPDIGSFHHEVLNQVFRILAERHGCMAPFARTGDGGEVCPREALDWGAVTLEQALEALDLALQTIRNEALEDGPLGPGRMAFFRQRSRRILSSALANLTNHGRLDHFVQVGAEIEFGFHDSALPPLPIPLTDGRRAALRGLIDRVDAAAVSAPDEPRPVRIIDYKSSTRTFQIGETLLGLGLQLPLYLQSFLTRGPADTRPAGAFYFSLRTRPERTEAPPAPGDAAAMETLRGFVDAESLPFFAPLEPGEKMPTINVTLKKDGAPAARGGDWLPAGVVEALCQRAVRAAAELVEAMLQRRIEVNPVRFDNQRDACGFCPFGDVCRVDPQTTAFRAVEKINRADALDRLEA